MRSFRNVPRAASSRAECTGICHLCLAGRPGFDFEDMQLARKHVGIFPVLSLLRSDNPRFLQTIDAEPGCDKDNEGIWTQVLMHDRDSPNSFHKVDVFHTISLGVGKSYAASSLSILQECMNGRSIDERMQELSCRYLEFCKDRPLRFSHQI